MVVGGFSSKHTYGDFVLHCDDSYGAHTSSQTETFLSPSLTQVKGPVRSWRSTELQRPPSTFWKPTQVSGELNFFVFHSSNRRGWGKKKNFNMLTKATEWAVGRVFALKSHSCENLLSIRDNLSLLNLAVSCWWEAVVNQALLVPAGVQSAFAADINILFLYS